jgi:hypothetical protein
VAPRQVPSETEEVNRRATVIAIACGCVGALSSVALADNPQLKPSALDQATAKRAIVQLSDFTPGSGWTGGPTKPSSSSSTKCNLDPKQSDLVQTAEAESSFKYKVPLFQIYSSATMYQNENMAKLSWTRAKPGILGFLRCLMATSLPSSVNIVSVKPMSFPQVGSFRGAYRTIFDITSGSTKVPMIIDLAIFGSGRTLFSLIQFATYDSAAIFKAGEMRLASAMAARSGFAA